MGIFHLLFILFISIPLIEIFLILEVHALINTLPTILLIIGTAVLGAALVRQQGIRTLQRVQMQMQNGQLPALEVLEGMVVLVAGALLLTPGFFTDTIGFLCLLPPLRRFMLLRLVDRVIKPRILKNAAAHQSQHKPKKTIDGEYWRDE